YACSCKQSQEKSCYDKKNKCAKMLVQTGTISVSVLIEKRIKKWWRRRGSNPLCCVSNATQRVSDRPHQCNGRDAFAKTPLPTVLLLYLFCLFSLPPFQVSNQSPNSVLFLVLHIGTQNINQDLIHRFRGWFTPGFIRRRLLFFFILWLFAIISRCWAA